MLERVEFSNFSPKYLQHVKLGTYNKSSLIDQKYNTQKAMKKNGV